ncbi:MAG: hypothetical protein PHT07_01585 [Paludibacter sp.]|nr:hypothetical protein [Paludibacter sp.]
MKTTEITTLIEQNAQQLIANIDVESIELYKVLKSEFEKSDVTENKKFQTAFSSFYGLDNVGFNEDFKNMYFKLIEKYRNHSTLDVEEVFIDLQRIKNFDDKDSIIFSFATKLMCTIDDTVPIYDKEVRDVFSFTEPLDVDFAMVIDVLFDQLENVQTHFNEIIEGNLLPVTLKLFDEKFKGNNLSVIKKLDFIFWSFGKLKILETHIDEVKVLY